MRGWWPLQPPNKCDNINWLASNHRAIKVSSLKRIIWIRSFRYLLFVTVPVWSKYEAMLPIKEYTFRVCWKRYTDIQTCSSSYLDDACDQFLVSHLCRTGPWSYVWNTLRTTSPLESLVSHRMQPVQSISSSAMLQLSVLVVRFQRWWSIHFWSEYVSVLTSGLSTYRSESKPFNTHYSILCSRACYYTVGMVV